MAQKFILLSANAGSLQTLVLPNDFNVNSHTISCYGPGGDGGSGAGQRGAGGGSGGCYAESSNVPGLAPGAAVNYQVGIPGPGSATWFGGQTLATALVGAVGGNRGGDANAYQAGAAGAAPATTNCKGDTVYPGGAGAPGAPGIYHDGGGGGGAGGPDASGRAGLSGSGNGGPGGQGDGTLGGLGATVGHPGSDGPGIVSGDLSNNIAGGGGWGGSPQSPGTNGGLYGAGAGGGSGSGVGGTVGGKAAQGAILIVYDAINLFTVPALVTSSPIIGLPLMRQKQVLVARSLITASPFFGSTKSRSYQHATVGDDWDLTNNPNFAGPYSDGSYNNKAILFMDGSGRGPYTISQPITKDDDQHRTYLWSVDAKDYGRWLEVGMTDDVGSSSWAVFDPLAGTTVYTTGKGSFQFVHAIAEPLANGFTRFGIYVTTNETLHLRAYLTLNDQTLSSTYAGDGTSGVYLSNPKFSEAGLTGREWPQMIGPPEMRFYWTVHVGKVALRWFRCSRGQCGVDPHLRIGRYFDLECLLRRWKPAHTDIVMDYSGVLSGVGDPMAGTP